MNKEPPPPPSKASKIIPYDLNQLRNKLNVLPLYRIGYTDFTDDELDILMDCNHHAFYHRSFPYATFLGLGTYYAIQKGYLKPNAKYGAKPKVAFAIFLGYILGKFSYQGICIQKLLDHPGSKFAKEFREQQRSRGHMEKFSLNSNWNWILSGFSLTPLRSLNIFNVKNDQQQLATAEKEEGIDIQIPLNISTSESRTYEELRKRNREEFRKQQQQQQNSSSQSQQESALNVPLSATNAKVY